MLTLEKVVESFEYWRAKRKNKKEHIPAELWAMAKNLAPYYKKADIQKALRISGGHFNKYCINANSEKPAATAEDKFVSGSFNPQHNETCELILSGGRNNLTIKTSINSVSQFLPLIEKYL